MCRGAAVQGADTEGKAACVRAVFMAEGHDGGLQEAGGVHEVARVGPNLL